MQSQPEPTAPGADDLVVVSGLRKAYADVEAVKDVSFSVGRGRITGFLGPNGAGKTTTLRMLLGLVQPTAGDALIEGARYADLPRPLAVVGAALDASAFSPGQTALDHLRIYAPLCGADDARIHELLERVGLTDAARRRVGRFSLGMKQRLALATALLGDPRVLVLDEPANGLDPQGIFWLRGFLRAYVDGGGTVLVSSHLLGELELIVDDVVLIDHGAVLYSGALAGLMRYTADEQVVHGPGTDRALALLRAEGITARELQSMFAIVGAPADRIIQVIKDGGLDPATVVVTRPTLETAFLDLTASTEASR